LDISFFVDVYMMGVCLCIFCLHLDDIIITQDSTKQADFVARHFIGFYVVIRVLRGFDGLFNIFGSKIIAKVLQSL